MKVIKKILKSKYCYILLNIVICIFISITFFAQRCVYAEQKEADEHYQRGLILYQQGNYLEAEQEFQKAISIAKGKKEHKKGEVLQDADREKDLNEKLSKMVQFHEDDLKNEQEKQRILYEQKLAEKYQQFDEALREKEKIYRQQIIDRDAEIETLRAQSGGNEAKLRQLIAKKDLEYNAAIEEQKNTYAAQVQALKQSSEQLKIYLTKLKEELKLRETALEEKDNHIALLTKKLALYSGEELADENKVSVVIKEELAGVKRENERLTRESEMLKQRLAEEQNSYKETLARQQQRFQDMQQASAAKLSSDLSAGEKKMQLIEARYIKQIGELERQNEKMKEEFELKLKDFAEKLQDKAAEDVQFKEKLSMFRQNQVTLLEEMLVSKATMMKKLPCDFSGAEKERARIYFERAIDAILSQKYSRAKYELEQALSLEPDSQATINILGSLNYFLKKKQ